MELAKSYQLHQSIINQRTEVAEVQRELRTVHFAYGVAFVATLAVYFIFIWMMYVSDLWGFSSWLARNVSEVAALAVYGVLAITLPLSMALIKEIGYKHFARFNNSLWLMIPIIAVLAFAGVVYEGISSSSQQQHISKTSAENSKSFAVIANAGVSVGSSNLGAQIAQAAQKLAQCETRLANGKEKHCNGDKAKLDALKQSQQLELETAKTANAEALTAKTQAIADLKEDAYKPVFKAIRDHLNVSIDTGVMLVTLFVSLIFEISHLLLIIFQGQKLRYLQGLKQVVVGLESDYLNKTGKAFHAADFNDESVLNLDDVRNKQATESKTQGVFKHQVNRDASFKVNPNPAPSFGFGFVPSNQLAQPVGLNPVASNQKESGLGFMGFVSPDHTPTPTQAKALGTHETQLPIPDFAGFRAGGGGFAAHLSEPEKPLIEPRARGFDKTTLNPVRGVRSEPDSLYPQWVEAVKQKECKPSVDATRTWLQKRIAPMMTGSKTNDLKRIDQMRKAFFNRAMHDGLMAENTNYTNGGRKYLWLA